MHKTQGYISFKLIFALVIVFILALIFAFILSSPSNPIFRINKFDQNKWLADADAGKESNKLDCQRGKMTQDLIDRVLTQKLSKKDVLNLLGDAKLVGKSSIEYPIGWCGFNYDSSLYIEFNTEFDGEYLQKAYLLKR